MDTVDNVYSASIKYINKACKKYAITEEQQGDCYFTEGEVLLFKSDLNQTENAFIRVLELHTQALDALGQANV